MGNPFTVSFGALPVSLIERNRIRDEVLEAFTDENPAEHVFMLTGIRGSGKTVLLTELANEFMKRKDWIAVNLSADQDLISQLAAVLLRRDAVISALKKENISISIPGFSLQIEGKADITTDPVLALKDAVHHLSKMGKSVLVTIDETTSTEGVRQFASQFQILLRENCRIFLLMAGLYENITDLQNEDIYTFLLRAPRIELPALNLNLIAGEYQKIFHLTDKESYEMAALTKGYSFAYQVVGYYCYKNQTGWKENLNEIDARLEEAVYDRLWRDLSPKCREILIAMAEQKITSVREIRQRMQMPGNVFSVYRQRLLKKQILYSPAYGQLEFSLPRFREFIIRKTWIDNEL